MKICAIVLNYRNAGQTETCLESLHGQGIDKVLVVDNSGGDLYFSEISDAVARQAELVDYGVRLINPGINLGFARGINFALGESDVSHCDAVLLINNDAVAQPGMVSMLATALTDGVFMVAPTVLDAARERQPLLWYQRFFGLQTRDKMPGSFFYLSGCCLLIRRSMLKNNRLFDEDFFMYGEDTLLGWQLARAGQVATCVVGAQVRHISGGSSRQGQLFYEYHTARAHVLLAQKTSKTVLEIPLLLVSKCMGLTLRALLRSVRFGSAVPLWAFILAWFPVKVRVP